MSVPKLDLAPKLNRPLSLWNPFDYLRLLYWVFYFPQAIKWYVDTFGETYIPEKETDLRKVLQILLQNDIQRHLFFQGLLLTIIFPILLCRFIEQLGIGIYWFGVLGGVGMGILISMPFSMTFVRLGSILGDMATGITTFLVLSVTISLVCALGFGVLIGVLQNMLTQVMTNIVIEALRVIWGSSIMANYVVRHYIVIVENAIKHMGFYVLMGVALGLLLNVLPVILRSLALDLVVDGLALSLAFSFSFSLALGIFGGVTHFVLYNNMLNGNIAFVVVEGIVEGLLNGVAFGVAFGVGIIRPDNWLISIPVNIFSVHNKSWLLPRITPLPLPKLKVRLHNWLLEDWEKSLDNLNQVLQYSFQFIPVISACHQALNKTASEKIIYRLTQLAQKPYSWELIYYFSASLKSALKLRFIKSFLDFPGFFFMSRDWKQRIKNKFIANICLDTSSHAGAAGFWYLHEKQPDKATEAFAVVKSLLYGEELFILAQNLATFQQAKEVKNIANLTITDFPRENLLRPHTWQVMNSLRRVVEDVKLIQQSASRNTKSFANNRAIGELTTVIDNQADIPEAERELIVDIATTWKKCLERISKDIGNVAITKPVRNPHIIGDPVTGNSFVGREDILRQLEELWITGNQLQSIVLFGHRRMGKTSILVNVANCTGAEIKVIYVNLQRLGSVSQGVAEVLMAISDEIADAFKIAPPDDDAFLKIPQRTFERYLKKVIADMPYRGLIIALDEFETIEELIQQGQIDPGFMGFLRGLVQMSPKIAFAFAGLHTLQEMTADYFQPFYASVIPIRVSFLNTGATKTILANPSNITEEKQNTFLNPNNNHQTSPNNELEEEFLLDYTGEALDLIYSLTSGQPYLVQLIGFQLVRNYNDQVFEQGTARDNTFTVEDVNKVVNESLFQQGRYYFEGVWGQAAQDATGKQDIITALAPHPQGLTIEEIADTTSLDTDNLTAAIEILKRHDVIKESDGKYRIIVELFRRWALTVISHQ